MRKRLLSAVILSALLLALAACSGENSSSGSRNDSSQSEPLSEGGAPESNAPETEQPAPDTSEAVTAENIPALPPEDINGIEDLNALYGPDGEKVDKYKITSISHGYDDDGNPDKTKWLNAMCDGFAYYSEPNAYSFNSADNAELVDEENWRFNVDEPPVPEYKRCEVGDVICGLKVTFASTIFGTSNADTNFVLSGESIVLGRELGIPEIFFLGSSVSFEGSLELTGHIFICPEDEGYDARGDIFFVPDKGSCLLPVVNFTFDNEKGICSRGFMITHGGDFFYLSEYPNIYAGNIFSNELDFSDYPIGEAIKVRLTAKDITMSSQVDWVTQTRFVITDIEKI